MIETALFISVLVNRLVEGIVQPFRQKYPDYDFWWLIYAAWVLAGVICFSADINLLKDIISNEILGKVVTAVIVGGGANLIRVFSPYKQEYRELAEESKE